MKLEKVEVTLFAKNLTDLTKFIQNKRVELQNKERRTVLPIKIDERGNDLFVVSFLKCVDVGDLINDLAMKDRPEKKDERMIDGCFRYSSGNMVVPGIGTMHEAKLKLDMSLGRIKKEKRGDIFYYSRVI